jgi:ABC-type amino acid transport substrate-binding protein
VGLDASFPPFEIINESGRIVGLDVDIAQAIAADLGVEAEFVNIGFDGLYEALLARRVDLIISGLPYDPRWTRDVAYTINYFNAGQVLVVRADDPTINSMEDVAGRTIAVEWGSQAEMEGRQLAEEVGKKTSEVSVKLLRQETAAAALDAVLDGQADVAIVDAPSALSAQRRGIRIVAYLSDEWYAAAVHIQSRELLAAINQTLARLEKSGEIVRLQARWFQGP